MTAAAAREGEWEEERLMGQGSYVGMRGGRDTEREREGGRCRRGGSSEGDSMILITQTTKSFAGSM